LSAARALLHVAFAVCASVGYAATAPDGMALYRHWCARCHGDDGGGRGLAAAALALNGTAPRDFTRGSFKWKSTAPDEGPSDGDLRRTIEHGLPGTSMPYFADLLSSDDVDRLIAVLRAFVAKAPRAAAPSISLGAPPTAVDVVGAGASRYLSLGCPSCHGRRGDGAGSTAGELRNADGSPAKAADLTRPWTFRAGSDVADVALRLATGIEGTPMPSYRGAASIDDLWAVAYYVRSLASAPSVRAAAIEAAKRPPGAGAPARDRGEYLAKAGTCFLCHVRMNPDGSYADGSFGAGGMPVEQPTLGTVFTRNLTPDRETGLGDWTAQDLRRAFREGRSRNGRALSALDMPWILLAELSDDDIDALYTYLHSLEPVRNPVPPPRAPRWSDAFLTKLVLLLRGEQMKESYMPSHPLVSARTAADTSNPSDALWLAAALLLVVVALARIAPRASIIYASLAAALWLLYVWPPLRFMPPKLIRARPPYQRVAKWISMPPVRLPPPEQPIGDPDLAALAARGRYVATFATCSFCHTTGPSLTRLYAPFPDMGGGMKVSWKVFGTTYSRNLTPDVETGLGAWSDAEIRRAITSGIARDGRLMHWQAMPWDHFSALSPEDLEALVFYLRQLPPVWSKVPAAQPPGTSDEPGDTFFFGYSGEYRR
jgi:mono/diheme cytochrome c family protein